jgi:amidase
VISFDTLGLPARAMEDVALFHAVLTGEPAPADGIPSMGRAPRIGVCRTPMWGQADKETHEAIEDAARRLSAAGAAVKDVAWPQSLEGVLAWREAVTNVDRSQDYAHEWRVAPETIGPLIRRNIEDGLKTRRADYNRSLKALDGARRDAEALFEGVDVLLAPVAVGVAPPIGGELMDPGFQQIWTMLHTPAISLPTHRGPGGLPVGIQLVAPRWEDERLLAAADWALKALGAAV